MNDSQIPTLTGPITGGTHGWPFAASNADLDGYGYVEEEYFLDLEARCYRAKSGTELGRDGRWQVEVAGSATCRTRFLVLRPADSAAFNGTVVVTWNNVTAGYELFGAESAEIFEGGFALVCATAQKAGIDGLPPLHQGLANWDHDRYGSLTIPSDDYSFDVFTQVGQAVGPRRNQDGIDPMAGLDVRHVVAQGASQSAGRLATYINAIAPLNQVFDAFIPTIYFGRGTPLEVGEAVVNPSASPAEAARRPVRPQTLLRDDLDTPVFVVNSELEAIACHGVRQPDTDRMRFWESAGTCHVSRQGRDARDAKLTRDGIEFTAADPNINAVPMAPLFDAAFHHVHRWLNEGTPPPVTPRVEFAGDPPEVVRDEHRIGKGGIRLPQVEVPLATNSSIPLGADDLGARLAGSSHPFGREQIFELYNSREEYLDLFERAANEAAQAGVLLNRDVQALIAEAGETWDRLVG